MAYQMGGVEVQHVLAPFDEHEGAPDITAKAGVRHIRLHDGRHTSATLLLMHGLHHATVSGWLGHADVAFTMRTYVHPQRKRWPRARGSWARSWEPRPARNTSRRLRRDL